MKFLSKNQVITQLKNLANKHKQVRGFGYGDRWELESALTKSDDTNNGLAEPNKQPFMWVTPIIARVSEGSLFYDFEIIVGDLVKKDETNELDVESDTLLICLDILSKLDDESYDWALDKQSNLQPFTEKWDSEFAGHIMNISLEFMFDYNYCQAPITPDDPDLVAFLTKTGIEDEDQIFALNYLITELKANNLWDKMHVVYPFVGGTAYRHSFNLINTAKYQIDWFGDVSHDLTGITGNGIDGYGNTNYVIPHDNQDSLHLSALCLSNNDSGMVLGSIYNLGSGTTFILSDVNTYAGRINQIGGGEISNEYTTSSDGFFVASRTSDSIVKSYRDSFEFFTENRASSVPPNLPLYLLCRNLYGTADYFSPSNIAFLSIGEGITTEEVSMLNIIVNKFQNYLKRKI